MYDNYRPQGFKLLPPVVKNLLIINALFYLATFTAINVYKVDLNNYLALHYFESNLFQPFQYITYMFMHANFEHILFNMFALWMFGYALENLWGPKRFLIYYMVTGIGAAFIQTFVTWIDFHSLHTLAEAFQQNATPDNFDTLMKAGLLKNINPEGFAQISNFTEQWRLNNGSAHFAPQANVFINQLFELKASIPTVGASGAVFGILLAFGMLFPNTLIFIYFLFPIKAKWFVIAYGAIELFSGFARTNDGIAHFAHLGGMIFGFLLIKYWRINRNTY
jgi:membrane associated rhomboid family serine protease